MTEQQEQQITADEILNQHKGYSQFVSTLFNRTGDPSKDFAHTVLGVLTECDEYLRAPDLTNAIEEAGDLMFFVTALGIVCREHFQYFDDTAAGGVEEFSALLTLSEKVGAGALWASYSVELMDVVKRWVGYGKEPAVGQAYSAVCKVVTLSGKVLDSGLAKDTDIQVVLKANVEKLLLRYKGLKFSAEKAVDRDVASEREVLERASQQQQS